MKYIKLNGIDIVNQYEVEFSGFTSFLLSQNY